MPAHHHSLQVRSPLKIEIKTNKYIAQRKQIMKIVFLDSKTIGDDIDLSEYCSVCVWDSASSVSGSP